MNQEQIMQIQIMEQESNQLNQHLQLVEENLSEMQELKLSLEELEKINNKDILANLGKKIYLPVEIKEKKLIVDVGNKNFVKKTIPETKNIIEDQIKKLLDGKEKITEELEKLQERVNKLMLEIQKSQEEKEKKK